MACPSYICVYVSLIIKQWNKTFIRNMSSWSSLVFSKKQSLIVNKVVLLEQFDNSDFFT